MWDDEAEGCGRKRANGEGVERKNYYFQRKKEREARRIGENSGRVPAIIRQAQSGHEKKVEGRGKIEP